MIKVKEYSVSQDWDVSIVMIVVRMTMLIPFTCECNYGKYGSIDDLKNIESLEV